MDIVNMNMDMDMNMDDVIEEIDRICGYGEEGHVNKDVKSDDYHYYHISLDVHPKNEEGIFWD